MIKPGDTYIITKDNNDIKKEVYKTNRRHTLIRRTKQQNYRFNTRKRTTRLL